MPFALQFFVLVIGIVLNLPYFYWCRQPFDIKVPDIKLSQFRLQSCVVDKRVLVRPVRRAAGEYRKRYLSCFRLVYEKTRSLLSYKRLW